MAKNRKSFNMIPEGAISPVVTEVEHAANVTSVTDNTHVTDNSNSQSVTQTSNVTQTLPVTQTNNVTQALQVQQPLQAMQPVVARPEERKRIYVSITMAHYLHAKRECGATGITLQDYFDSLIEKDMKENTPHYIQ